MSFPSTWVLALQRWNHPKCAKRGYSLSLQQDAVGLSRKGIRFCLSRTFLPPSPLLSLSPPFVFFLSSVGKVGRREGPRVQGGGQGARLGRIQHGDPQTLPHLWSSEGRRRKLGPSSSVRQASPLPCLCRGQARSWDSAHICPSGSSLRLSSVSPRGPGGLWISLRWRGQVGGAEEPAHLAGMALMGFL